MVVERKGEAVEKGKGESQGTESCGLHDAFEAAAAAKAFDSWAKPSACKIMTKTMIIMLYDACLQYARISSQRDDAW